MGSVRFPFEAPRIIIDVREKENYVSQFDLRYATFEDIMKEHWHPSIKLVDIAERTLKFIEKNLMPASEIHSIIGSRMHSMVARHDSGVGKRNPYLKVLLFILAVNLLRVILCTLLQGNDSLKTEIAQIQRVHNSTI